VTVVGSGAQPWFVAVGASGVDGLADIRTLLNALPQPLRAVVLVVLHRSWDKPSHLQAVLAKGSAHPILIADEGERFEPGCIYIGEPAQHLTLAARSLVEIIDDPARLHRNRTVDLLFRSVARHGNGRMIGVVLSGSLDDGSRGLAAIHEAGGLTMVITPVLPSKVGMPENAIAYDGPIDTIGTSEMIASAIAGAIGDD
jgi:two-component system chemotaxis response regulator CheB